MLLHIAAWTPTPKQSLGRRKKRQKLQQKFTVTMLHELEGTFANRNFFSIAPQLESLHLLTVHN